jgi:hypothetical protein
MAQGIQFWGNLAGAVGLFDKASVAISQFGSTNPAVAPASLCRLYFLLAFLRDESVRVVAEPRELKHLEDHLKRCRTLLEQHDPAAAAARDDQAFVRSLTYAWPADADAELHALIEEIDRELVELQFIAHGPRPTWSVLVSLAPRAVIDR